MTTRKGGAGKCSICSRPERDAIDQQLVAGEPLDRIARTYGLTSTSLRRHRDNHPRRDLVKLDTDTADTVAIRPGANIDVPQGLNDQYRRTLAAMRVAEKSGSLQAIAGAQREHRLTLKVIADWNAAQAKLELLKPKGAFNVLQTSTWRETSVLLYMLLEPWPEVRIAVANGLYAHERKHGVQGDE